MVLKRWAGLISLPEEPAIDNPVSVPNCIKSRSNLPLVTPTHKFWCLDIGNGIENDVQTPG